VKNRSSGNDNLDPPTTTYVDMITIGYAVDEPVSLSLVEALRCRHIAHTSLWYPAGSPFTKEVNAAPPLRQQYYGKRLKADNLQVSFVSDG